MLSVAIVMTMPMIAAIVGNMMWFDRFDVLSEYQVFQRQKAAVTRYGYLN